ncbi:MAG: argininosuccinate synthase [Cyclobacteriaceae bacterium]|nr:argininosuccinate synthase [Cyclobacteriaceae bacterium]
MSHSKKVVLAFSGGLDTSYCVKYLQQEKGLEVHAVLVNTGGFSSKELNKVEQQAKKLGASSFKVLDKVEAYYDKVIKFLIYGNVLKNNTYPLSVSAERTVQAVAIAQYATALDADFIAHGSTGAGNDQVRFDLVFQTLAPNCKILTPIRDLQLSREQEIDYLKSCGVEASWEKSKYSINKGLWGTSVGGVETLTSNTPLPETAWPSQLEQTESEQIAIEFKKGEPVGLNGKKLGPVKTIEALNTLGSSYAIGRDIHIGDTIIGIKGRVGFEAPAAIMLIKAHHSLEKHTLSKWQLNYKEQLASWYGMLLHEAQYLDPVMRNIEAFLADSQKQVTGSVKLTLAPYRFSIDGVESPYDLMNNDFGAYGEMNKAWSGEDVKGFTKIMANQHQLFNAITHK